MAITDSGLIRLMTDKMAYLSQRQAVLAENVANANAPGYKAKDLKPFTFEDALKESQGGEMKVTNAKHIIPASMAGANASTERMKPFETLPSGNAVDLEQQMTEVSKTAIEYQSMLAMFHKFMGLFKTAVGK